MKTLVCKTYEKEREVKARKIRSGWIFPDWPVNKSSTNE